MSDLSPVSFLSRRKEVPGDRVPRCPQKNILTVRNYETESPQRGARRLKKLKMGSRHQASFEKYYEIYFQETKNVNHIHAFFLQHIVFDDF